MVLGVLLGLYKSINCKNVMDYISLLRVHSTESLNKSLDTTTQFDPTSSPPLLLLGGQSQPPSEWHREWWSDKTLINCIFHMND